MNYLSSNNNNNNNIFTNNAPQPSNPFQSSQSNSYGNPGNIFSGAMSNSSNNVFSNNPLGGMNSMSNMGGMNTMGGMNNIYTSQSNNKLGSNRVENYDYLKLSMKLQSQSFYKDCTPISINLREETFHLTPTQLRYEDYYLARKKQMNLLQEKSFKQAQKNKMLNPELFNTNQNTQLKLHPYSSLNPLTTQEIKGLNTNRSQGYPGTNSYGLNTYTNNSSQNTNMYQQPMSSSSSNNIFTQSSSSMNTLQPQNTNMFGNQTSMNSQQNNAFQQASTSNNSTSNNIFNQSSNTNQNTSNNNIFNQAGHNIFAQSNANANTNQSNNFFNQPMTNVYQQPNNIFNQPQTNNMLNTQQQQPNQNSIFNNNQPNINMTTSQIISNPMTQSNILRQSTSTPNIFQNYYQQPYTQQYVPGMTSSSIFNQNYNNMFSPLKTSDPLTTSLFRQQVPAKKEQNDLLTQLIKKERDYQRQNFENEKIAFQLYKRNVMQNGYFRKKKDYEDDSVQESREKKSKINSQNRIAEKITNHQLVRKQKQSLALQVKYLVNVFKWKQSQRPEGIIYKKTIKVPHGKQIIDEIKSSISRQITNHQDQHNLGCSNFQSIEMRYVSQIGLIFEAVIYFRRINIPPDYYMIPVKFDQTTLPQLTIGNNYGCIQWFNINITRIDFTGVISIQKDCSFSIDHRELEVVYHTITFNQLPSNYHKLVRQKKFDQIATKLKKKVQKNCKDSYELADVNLIQLGKWRIKRINEFVKLEQSVLKRQEQQNR